MFEKNTISQNFLKRLKMELSNNVLALCVQNLGSVPEHIHLCQGAQESQKEKRAE